KLEDAGIGGAGLFVLTDVEEATGIPIAKELNSDVRIVTYATRSLPEFVATVADLAVDPALLDAATVAEELT
ncbi:CTP synthetase, partial [Halorubrum sp. SS7]